MQNIIKRKTYWEKTKISHKQRGTQTLSQVLSLCFSLPTKKFSLSLPAALSLLLFLSPSLSFFFSFTKTSKQSNPHSSQTQHKCQTLLFWKSETVACLVGGLFHGESVKILDGCWNLDRLGKRRCLLF